jgi:hypothetical protein
MIERSEQDKPKETDVDGGNGRDPTTGRFLPGNRLSKGHDFNRRLSEWRGAVSSAVSGEDLAAVIKALVKAAKAGDVAAATLLFRYTLGVPTQSFVVEERTSFPVRILGPDDPIPTDGDGEAE